MIKHWIAAARLRTLPLSLSSILMGSFLAVPSGRFSFLTFVLIVLTTVLLQVLSNFANDYGDAVSGVDSVSRTVATRAVQSGNISKEKMKKAIVLTAILSFLCGSILILRTLSAADFQTIILFFALGILCIAGAIFYTMGKRPYGYMGLGDLSVLIFFGWVAVLGTYYLQTNEFEWVNILPATSVGLLAVGVLNLNNIRDIETDRKSGKSSIPTYLGKQKATLYHCGLMIFSVLFMIIFQTVNKFYFEKEYIGGVSINIFRWIFLLSALLLILICTELYQKNKPEEIDKLLKKMALSSLFMVTIFGLSYIVVYLNT